MSWITFGRELDEEGSRGIIARFLEAGGNFIDTADVYENGASEEIVGYAASRWATARTMSASRASTSWRAASYKRLGTNYIDLYQVHTW